MKRVLVFGGNGAGKTTFARELAPKLRLPLVHLDQLYWRDNWQHATDAEFDALLLAELQKSEWLIDGNILRTLPTRLQYCDTAIFLDFSRTACALGTLKRLLQSLGRSRSDMGGNCVEHLDMKELKFIWGVWKNTPKMRKRIESALSDVPNVRVIRLKNRRAVREFLKQI